MGMILKCQEYELTHKKPNGFVFNMNDQTLLAKISKNGFGIGDRDEFIREAAEKKLKAL